jgi:hypothetical protein
VEDGRNVWDEVPDWGASEELLVVLRGTPTVRTHDGDRQ